MFILWAAFSVVLVICIVIYGNQDYARPADAIIVLGAGLQEDGSPTETMIVRVERGAALFHEGIAPHVICTGSATGMFSDVTEAEVCQQILIENAVPPEAILYEDRSFNTEENARYSLEVMASNDIETVVVVSSRYHLLRARWLFWKQGQHIHTSPAMIGHLPPRATVYVYWREWAAFHWNALRPFLPFNHFNVPIP